MTIRGSLADLEIVELLQTVAAGRLSGELLVAGPEDVARLFFENGRLCQAQSAGREGQGVLVDVVGWEEGEFEFRPKAAPQTRSLNVDLYRALMLALKTRDERRAGQQAPASETQPGHSRALLIHQRLVELVASNAAILHALVVKREGGRVVVCAADSEDLPAELEDLAGVVFAVMDRHPRPPLHRLLIEDGAGVVVAVPLAAEATLVVVAGPEAPLGAVTLNVRRLAMALDQCEAAQAQYGR